LSLNLMVLSSVSCSFKSIPFRFFPSEGANQWNERE
jgi:hypothetical protein